MYSLIEKLIYCTLFLLTWILPINGNEEWVKFGMANRSVLPKNYRSTLSHAATSSLPETLLIGLNEIHASASGQFSEASLGVLVKELPYSFLIVDLRQESHGFINGVAISWRNEHNNLNLGMSPQEISADENARLADAMLNGVVIALDDQYSFLLPCQDAMTEEELMESRGLHYLRIPITDYSRPDDQAVDQLVSLIRELPEQLWLHFHCGAGRGRATTAMIMYDMLHNAHKLSFEEILLRQKLIGGKDCLDLPEEGKWKRSLHEERLAFLKKFHVYCLETRETQESWASWIESSR